MAYNYEEMREHIFTEENQKMFLSIRDRSKRLIDLAGCATMGKLIAGESGDSWHMMACVDRLIELDELHEIKQEGYVAGQYRIFTKRDW